MWIVVERGADWQANVLHDMAIGWHATYCRGPTIARMYLSVENSTSFPTTPALLVCYVGTRQNVV